MRFQNLLVMLSMAVTSLAVASGAAFAGKLDDVSCRPLEHPTGCIAPFRTCDVGKMDDARSSCRIAAKSERCGDFTWEKCCYVTCRHLAGRDKAAFERCSNSCNTAPENAVFVPRALKRAN